MKNYNVINPKYLLKISNNDIVFIEKIYNAFISQTSILIKNLKESLVLNDTDYLSKIIHKLKSAFLVLGIQNCNVEFKIQELHMLQAMKYNDLKKIVDKFEHVYLDAIEEMTIFIKYLKK